MTTPKRTAFKAANGRYVTLAGGTDILQATSDTIDSTGIFEIVQQENMMVALLAPNGKYVSNQENGGLPLAATSATIGAQERFALFNWGKDDSIVLQASNQDYVQLTTTGSALQALTGDLSAADAFALVPVPGAVNAAAVQAQPVQAVALAAASNPAVFTVCFSGTGCTRDEGEVSRNVSDKDIYCSETGYIPIRIHKEISGSLKATTPSVSIRGVGENDWAVPRDSSEPLQFNGPLKADADLLDYVKSYSGGNQYSQTTQFNGWSAPALALHAANLAAASGKQQYNFIGHSRGAVECIMAAWFIFMYGGDQVKNIPINIFAIDPVPGKGQWYSLLTQLPPNVVNYVGIYAWDMCVQPLDSPFMAVVPRPNGLMMGQPNTFKPNDSWFWTGWKYLADKAQRQDPLAAGNAPQLKGYELYACRGRHSTVAGNSTADGKYLASNVSDNVAPVPELVYKMARGYLTEWGTVFPAKSAVDERVLSLRRRINTNHREFDAMGGGETRTSALALRPYVRRISSIYGVNPTNSYYMDNVVGDPPYKMDYPVTSERTDAGWVNWKFL